MAVSQTSTISVVILPALMLNCKSAAKTKSQLESVVAPDTSAMVLTGTKKGYQQKPTGGYELVAKAFRTCVSKQAKKIVGEKFAKDAVIQKYLNILTAEPVFHFGDLEKDFLSCIRELAGSWENPRPGVNDPAAKAVSNFDYADLYTIKDERDLAKYECDPSDHDKWSETMSPCYAALKQQLVPDRQANGGKYSGDW